MILPRGCGRSYGDSCLVPDGGCLVDMRSLDRFIQFDEDSGILRCEAGVTLDTILKFMVPCGWFVPVTPGTRFVTVGGAIANDVHGKNHHRQGSFGNHVLQFELLRSDGSRTICSPTENADWFEATIGGLGLTGAITWVDLRLRRIDGPLMDVETLRFDNAGEFFRLSNESDAGFEYTVAWIDCLARGRQLGRGIFMRGNHTGGAAAETTGMPRTRLRVPVMPPVSLVNGISLRAFNSLYYHWPRAQHSTSHFVPFFYPLDRIGDWNRIYGRKGFLQYQCVVPLSGGQEVLNSILGEISRSGTGSFLAVLKVFGRMASKGWLSFPREGITLALDFPFGGHKTLALLDRLDSLVRAVGGAVYPAKDARMSPAVFQRFFPAWERLEAYRDPSIMSAFWSRVTERTGKQ